MNESQFTSELLKAYFPKECATVGPTNLQDIVEGGVEFKAAERGSYMDLGSAIATLSLAASFITIVIEAYKLTRTELNRKPTSNEVVIRITLPKDVAQGLDSDARRQLAEAVISELDSER